MTALQTVSPAKAAQSKATPARQSPALCFLVDAELTFRQEFAKFLCGVGLETVDFPDSTRLVENVDNQNPAIIFLNLNATAPYDCVRALISLQGCNYKGPVQLVGRCEHGFLQNFHKIGVRSSLNMLPVLQKPIEFSIIRKIAHDFGLGGPPVPPSKLSLGEALTKDWIQFWYQPKIDFKTAQVVGAEAFARISHPEFGVMAPGRFLGGAADTELIELTRRALLNAIQASTNFEKIGLRLKIAINISVEALMKVPIANLIRQNRPSDNQWPGLIFDVTERQAVNETAMVAAKFLELKKLGVDLAIDDFGRGSSSFAIFKHLPCAEIKIDRSFVNGCSTNKSNSQICKTMIQMAHNFDAKVAAVGIETHTDSRELAGMGCDIGQGYRFGKPMPEAEFVKAIGSGPIKL